MNQPFKKAEDKTNAPGVTPAAPCRKKKLSLDVVEVDMVLERKISP
jgi:hypothetical protein